jgi:hypothetical protein
MKKPNLQGEAPKRRQQPASRATSSSARHEADAINTDKDSGPPPRHPAAPLRQSDHQHHLPGPPSRHTTTRKSSNNAARHSHPQPKLHKANCSQTTAAAPPPGPPPRPKSQTAAVETRRPSRQSHRPSDTRLSPEPSQVTPPPHDVVTRHGSRGHHLDAQTTSARGRCPDIHHPTMREHAPIAEQGLQDDASRKVTT